MPMQYLRRTQGMRCSVAKTEEVSSESVPVRQNPAVRRTVERQDGQYVSNRATGATLGTRPRPHGGDRQRATDRDIPRDSRSGAPRLRQDASLRREGNWGAWRVGLHRRGCRSSRSDQPKSPPLEQPSESPTRCVLHDPLEPHEQMGSSYRTVSKLSSRPTA